jgi:hypothetical protein
MCVAVTAKENERWSAVYTHDVYIIVVAVVSSSFFVPYIIVLKIVSRLRYFGHVRPRVSRSV